MNILWRLRNNNLFGSFESKPSGHLKKMLRDQSSAVRNESLINKGTVSLTIIPTQRLHKGDFSMLFKDQAIHKCNQTKHRLPLCTSTSCFICYVGLGVPGAEKKMVSV